MALTGCSGVPKLFWGLDEGVDKKSQQAKPVKAEVRPALEVPPELRGKVEVPAAEHIATREAMPERYKKAVAGKHVALDARVYPQPVDRVFSAVVDAMTALNLPVNSVDSASGTITTDWVRTDANTTNDNSFIKGFDIFGSHARAIRYRYVVRVMRLRPDAKAKGQTRLQIRTMAQAFIGKHWVNKKLKRKFSTELFSRVEEMLAHDE